MKPDFFKYLPTEITTNIFLRLSVRTIAVGKCVCKSWLQLLETDDFVTSHFAQSAPALALTMRTEDSNWYKLLELEEDLDLDPLTRFAFPYKASIEGSGSANGLLFLLGMDRGYHLYICNPITRESIDLFRRGVKSFGFGVSRISGQYKAVCINPRCLGEDRGFQCYVYTLGTGSWRLIEATDSFEWSLHMIGAFVHGNLHWTVSSDRISCFDLETEHFSNGFTVPSLHEHHRSRQLYNLRDSLCFCHRSWDGGGIGVAIWMMKEYGVGESWTKEYVIDLGLGDLELQWFHPIKVFENGDVLLRFDNKFFYYSKTTRTSREVGALSGPGEDEFGVTSMLHTPSMVSLKCFAPMENVVSF